MQVYTWPDATLRELTDLVKEVKSEARRTTAKFEFAFVYPDRRGRNVLRQVRHDLLEVTWCLGCDWDSKAIGSTHHKLQYHHF